MKRTPFRRLFGALVVSGVARRMRRNGVSDEVIEEFLSDDTLQNAAIEHAEETYDGPRAKGDFLKWLSEHSDEIIKLILTLITLFAQESTQLSDGPAELGDKLLQNFTAPSGPDIFVG